MRALRLSGLAALLALAGTGCQNMGSYRTAPPVAMGEPSLADPAAPSAVAEAPPSRTVTWVDRHPLFYKPRDYFEGSGTNPIVKATAATVIGIPAGLFGEMRQIVSGSPARPAY